jgi:hypothetical protein
MVLESATDGDRVVLDRDAAATGTVRGAVVGDMVYVKLDSGSAAAFPLGALSLLPATVTESKSWPPEGIETK